MEKKTMVILVVLFSACLWLQAQTKTSKFKIANKIHLSGDAGWDYLTADDLNYRLYVSHGNMVQVIDTKNDALIGTISGQNGVHGIALAIDLGKGFISNGRDSSVTVFDLKTLKTVAKIKVTGRNPDAILYDPFSHKVFTFNGGSSSSSVIDAKTNLVISTIPLDGKPEFSVTDGNGRIYVNIEDKSLLCEINSTTLKVERTWSIAPGEEPSGLAIDNETHRLFSVCDNKLMVISDAQEGKVIATEPIGERVDGVAFDPGKKFAYSSNGEGNITVVQEESKDKFSVFETIETQKGARTISVDKSTHRIYLPTADFGTPSEASASNPRPRPAIKPNSFIILVIEPL